MYFKSLSFAFGIYSALFGSTYPCGGRRNQCCGTTGAPPPPPLPPLPPLPPPDQIIAAPIPAAQPSGGGTFTCECRPAGLSRDARARDLPIWEPTAEQQAPSQTENSYADDYLSPDSSGSPEAFEFLPKSVHKAPEIIREDEPLSPGVDATRELWEPQLKPLPSNESAWVRRSIVRLDSNNAATPVKLAPRQTNVPQNVESRNNEDSLLPPAEVVLDRSMVKVVRVVSGTSAQDTNTWRRGNEPIVGRQAALERQRVRRLKQEERRRNRKNRN